MIIKTILKQIHEVFVDFRETGRETLSAEAMLLEEGLAQERADQEQEHEKMRDAMRQKTRKETRDNQTRILRKARSLVTECEKNLRVWDDDSSSFAESSQRKN